MLAKISILKLKHKNTLVFAYIARFYNYAIIVKLLFFFLSFLSLLRKIINKYNSKLLDLYRWLKKLNI